MRAKIILCLGAALVCTAGCAAANLPVGVPPYDFGNAVSQNIAAETVNPTAPIDKGLISIDAQRARLGLDRYLNDNVKEPSDISTGVVISGGGSNGMNSSGGASGGAGPAGATAQ